ncbi:hypothetical protein OB236_23685 [Paenibacillus sp. WQ 127069]|uniref:Uncharacterized protein n=1 Tax=Paenibacillus baimaensis TaxID=2982185 RepID=A0ABT2UKE5_9BACL|nr:hypothetical protein [Paenibacillus sp. WQ 127069]MCU6795115.1 hypothetical protein [Paenibacillus sp. WQ 127069]
MNAANFNLLYEEIVINTLQAHGYFPKGQSLFITKGTMVAALLRSSFRGEQATDIIFCIRHAFLRDHVTLTTKNVYLKDAVDYPFRFSIIKFTEKDLFAVKYTPINYSRARLEMTFESIYYGDTDAEDTKEITDQLEIMTDNIIKYGPQIMNLLSPKKSCGYISQNNRGAWIEKVWLEDYENHIYEQN